MAHATTPSLVRQLGSLFDGGSVAGLSDRQLLDRFVARRDAAGEAAFAALVARHGPMVLGVCRQLLGDRHHAEDTFQAVFLVLARRAGAIRDPDLLGNWLYGVALRTARKGKARLGRQRRKEEGDARNGLGTGAMVEPMAPPADQPAIDREQAEVLHDEIDRLPGAFRLSVVLCYFEGLTLDEAARQLRCPPGTLRSRLARARDKLRRGLTRRGVVLPAAALAAVLESRPVSASVSSSLCDITTRAAIQFAAGQAVSPFATALAQEVLRSMFVNKLKFVALTFLFLGAVAAGAGLVSQVPVRQAGKPDLRQTTTKPDDANPKPAAGRMFVAGRVLDPNGKPVPGATIMVQARSLALGLSTSLSRRSPVPIVHSRADSSGRFRLEAPRTSSSRYDQFGAVAIAPGHGAAWIKLNPDTDQPTADITLRPEQVIHGRMFDLQGRPVPGATVSVWLISQPPPPDRSPVRDRIDGVSYWWTDLNDFPAWPRPATTDTEGRFTLRGVGRDLRVLLAIRHPRFALHPMEIKTDGTSESKSLTIALEPAKVITGRVTYADTRKPVPHAPLEVLAWREGTSGGIQTEFETDAEGRFRIRPTSGDRYSATAHPPAGQPYLNVTEPLDWPKGAIERSLDLALPRGVMIRGRVAEEGSGKPVPGAVVRWAPYAFATAGPGRRTSPAPSMTTTDGSFQVAASAGPGYLVVQGPSDDYVLREFGAEGGYFSARPGSRRFYAHAYQFLDLKPEGTGQDVALVLRPGATIRGRVLGPDGKPVRDAWIISQVIVRGNPTGGWKDWNVLVYPRVHDGRFELHGLDPDTEVPVYFLDARHELGATVSISGKSAAGGALTVRLEPCGTARARFVDPGGKPVPRLRRSITMVVTPGPPSDRGQVKEGRLFANEGSLSVLDPTHYGTRTVSDAQGRMVFPDLIPGATYRLLDSSVTGDDGSRLVIRKEFTVKPGETVDLGDILVQKPRS